MMIAIDMSTEEDTVSGATLGTGIPVVLAIRSKTVCASRIAAIEDNGKYCNQGVARQTAKIARANVSTRKMSINFITTPLRCK
jgi:hypothetical protein